MILIRLAERNSNFEAENDKLKSKLIELEQAIEQATKENEQKDFHIKAMKNAILVLTEELDKKTKELKDTQQEKSFVISHIGTKAASSSSSAYEFSENDPQR